MPDIITLTSSQIALAIQPLLDELGKTYRERFEALLPLFETGKASLAQALQVVAPGKARAEALAAFQVFCTRLNTAAAEVHAGFELVVDSEKRRSPEERFCWLEGPDPALANLAAFTTEAVSTLDRVDALVQPSGIVTTGAEMESKTPPRRLIRFFLSYAHKDQSKVLRLEQLLETQLKLSKRFQFEIWHDRKIEVGTGWHGDIQSAIEGCDFGLLLVSPEFLVSKYISDHELPHFVNGSKPLIPVGLVPLDFGRMELKGLQKSQFFLLKRDDEAPRFFSHCAGNLAAEFASSLAAEIERRVTSSSAKDSGATFSISLRPGQPPKSPENLRQLEDLSRYIDMGLPDQTVTPEGTTTALSRWERDGKLNTENRTDAVEYLVNWACDPEQTPFAAVLGEIGIGKTTTLMMVARELQQRHKKDPKVPVPIFIDLREYCREQEPTLENILTEVIRRHWKGEAGKTLKPETIVNAVREQGALVIFDGLDERIIPLPEAKRVGFIRELWRVLPPDLLKGKKTKGRMILSCRSHYFPNVVAQNSAFVSEGRDGIKARDYTACIILPFREKQIEEYVEKVLGADRVEAALALVRSVHNLSDLAKRPYLLSLIVDQIGELEQIKASGRPVLGVSLYELFVQKWLRRDEGKHILTPEHKITMMESLALAMWQENAREWPWTKVGKWLDQFLHRHPEIGSRYAGMSAEVVNQDFRTATFLLRPDTSKDGFRFAHTSLQEYFLAARLVRALEENTPEVWSLRQPSDESLDFAGQMITLKSPKERDKAMTALTALLEDAASPALARTASLRYWLTALPRGWPIPTPVQARLDDLNLEKWSLAGTAERVLDLRGASLKNACLDFSTWRRADVTGAAFDQSSARGLEFQNVQAIHSTWEGADLTGSTLRDSPLDNISAQTTRWHDVDLVRSATVGARLPERWREEAASRTDELVTTATIALRQGHSSLVNGCAFSPDGSHLLSASWDNTLKLWDAHSGRRLLTLRGHSNWVNGCAFSPDGSRLLSASHDKMLKLWDATSGRCLLTLQGHSSSVSGCAFSPDGSRLLSASHDKTLKLWDAHSGRCLITLQGHSDWVNGCAFSPDGSRLLSVSDDNTLKLWDATSGRCLLTLQGHSDTVNACAFSPDGSHLLSASDDNTLKLWNATSGRCLLTLQGHSDRVNGCAFSPDGSRLLSASSDNTLKLWDATSGRCLLTLQGHSERVNACAFSPGGSRMLSASDDNALTLWDVHSGDRLLTLQGHSSSVSGCAFSPDGSRLLSASSTLKLWDAHNGCCLLTLKGHSDWVNGCAFSPDGSRLLSASHDKTLKLWDAASGRCLLTLQGHSSLVNGCAFSPDGFRLLSASDDNTLKLWDAHSGRCVLTLKGHSDKVNGCVFAPDGSCLLSASDDNTLKLWHARSGCCLLTLQGHSNWVSSCAFSPDGCRLLSGSWDNTLKLWDTNGGDCQLTLQGHSNRVTGCVFSPDGSRLLSASSDNTLKLWDATSGRCLLTLQGHSASVSGGCAFSPDGSRLLSSGSEGTLREWRTKDGSLLKTIVIGPDKECAVVDFPGNRILHATPDAWRLLGWEVFDPEANRRRLLPAEFFGPLPAFP